MGKMAWPLDRVNNAGYITELRSAAVVEATALRPPAMRALVLSRSLRNTIRSFVRQDAEYSVTASDGPATGQTLGRCGSLCCSLERSGLVRCFELN